MLDVPEIAEFNLPSKFSFWRPGQQEMISKVVDSQARFTGMCMPTGAGKSAVYMALAGCFGRTVILTSTKGLQDQLIKDFTEMGLKDIRGQNNYRCKYYETYTTGSRFVKANGRGEGRETTCDEGPCHAGFRCKLKQLGCDYYDQKRRVRGSQLVVTNYSYWLGNENQNEKASLGKFDLLVCDEAHNCPDELGDYLMVETHAVELEELLGVPFPDSETDAEEDFSYWKEWATSLVEIANRMIAPFMEESDEPLDRGAMRWLMRMTRLRDRLMRVADAHEEWIHESFRDRRGTRTIRFSPVDVRKYGGYLFREIPRVLLVSATIRPKTMALLGIGTGNIGSDGGDDFLESKRAFAKDRRMLAHIPTVRMSHGIPMDQMLHWVSRIDQITDRRLDRKGILHTVSYKRAQLYMDKTRHRDIVWMPKSGELRSAVEEFRTHPEKMLLVSPALTTGYDFPDDECRYQIIGKIPFPDTRSKILQARVKLDPDYAAYIAMQILVQTCGRGIRSEEDWCENFIIDDHWLWFWKRYRNFAPAWFGEAVKFVQTVPDARRQEVVKPCS